MRNESKKTGRSMRRVIRRCRVVVTMGAGLLLATSCGLNLRDAVSTGLYQFVTQTTVDFLGSVLSIDGDTASGSDGNIDGGSGDPFDSPPSQP